MLRCGRAPLLCAMPKAADAIRMQIEALNDRVLRPNDAFGFVPKATYNAPMVLLLGNHSAGKSTFINQLLGRPEQETGVAPTDDGFTVIMRGDVDMDVDGPSAVSSPKYQFEELKDFNQQLVNHFRLKVRNLPPSSFLPEGMMVIDSPGMIDTPVHVSSRTSVQGQGRGYDFLKVTEWMAKRSDVILLLFDPANPGTTGETLDVLTKSLAGMEHKFLILMNKADVFDKVTDFARAYGTICWNLSKVIPMKDIPRIYTTFTPSPDRPLDDRKLAVPVAEMERARREVLHEVLRAPLRRLDNLITEMEEGSRRVSMAAKVCTKVRRRYLARSFLVSAAAGTLSFAVPALAFVTFLPTDIASLLLTGIVSIGTAAGSKFAASNHLHQYATVLQASIDSVVDEIYPGKKKTHDIIHRWESHVRPAIRQELSNGGHISRLPVPSGSSIAEIDRIADRQVPALREEVRVFKEEALQTLYRNAGQTIPK